VDGDVLLYGGRKRRALGREERREQQQGAEGRVSGCRHRRRLARVSTTDQQTLCSAAITAVRVEQRAECELHNESGGDNARPLDDLLDAGLVAELRGVDAGQRNAPPAGGALQRQIEGNALD